MYSLLGGSLQTGGGRRSAGRRSGRRSARRSSRRSVRRSASGSARRSGRKSVRRSARRSGRRSARRSSKAVGSRASVARGGAKHTPGGLTLGNGLFRSKTGKLKSVAVSRQAKAKYNKNPALQARAKLVKEGFKAVRAVKGSKKINARGVLKNPADAAKNPRRYLM